MCIGHWPVSAWLQEKQCSVIKLKCTGMEMTRVYFLVQNIYSRFLELFSCLQCIQRTNELNTRGDFEFFSSRMKNWRLSVYSFIWSLSLLSSSYLGLCRAFPASSQPVWARSQESLSSLLRPSSHSQLVASFIWSTVYACSCSGYSQLVAYHLCMRSLQRPASQFRARYQPNLSSLQRTASHLNS